MSACAGVIQTVGTFGWWAGYFSHQNGGDVVYFKDTFNHARDIVTMCAQYSVIIVLTHFT